MPTIQDLLDAGMPSPGGSLDEARAYGQAYLAVTGSPAAPSSYGSFLRRTPSLLPRVTVTAGQCVIGPGLVGAVQELGGMERGLTIVLTRSPVVGEVRVLPQADGTQVLVFWEGEDTPGFVAVYLLGVPAQMIAALDSEV